MRSSGVPLPINASANNVPSGRDRHFKALSATNPTAVAAVYLDSVGPREVTPSAFGSPHDKAADLRIHRAKLSPKSIRGAAAWPERARYVIPGH
jgi:hypothetical protein